MAKMTLTHANLKAMISETVNRILSGRMFVAENASRDLMTFKFVMNKIAEKSWSLKRWAVKKQATLGALETAFKKHTDYSTNGLVRNYLDKKSRETRKYPWDLAIEFDQMDSSEQDAEIEKYLKAQDAEMLDETMDDVISTLKEKYADIEPAEMPFDEICSAIREINDVMDKFGAYEPGKKEIFDEFGIFDLKKRFMSEWKARR